MSYGEGKGGQFGHSEDQEKVVGSTKERTRSFTAQTVQMILISSKDTSESPHYLQEASREEEVTLRV